jgi:hypothetical protein
VLSLFGVRHRRAQKRFPAQPATFSVTVPGNRGMSKRSPDSSSYYPKMSFQGITPPGRHVFTDLSVVVEIRVYRTV